MYGQGNFASKLGQGPHTSMSPIQQRLPAPPPPPFQQGSSAPRLVQQGPPSVPPHGGQLPPSLYLHAPPAPLQQGPHVPVAPSGMLNSGQSYLTPPPPAQVHGNTPMAHSYSTTQQNSQWTHNVHHIPLPVPPLPGPPPTGPSYPEMLRHPPAPRVLPPPPLLGQALYRGSVHPSQPGGIQGLQHAPPPPPPPPPPPSSSRFFTPAPFGSFVQSVPQDSHMPSFGLVPPPPPSSPPGPPPLPPSSPPPTSPPPCFGTPSSEPVVTASDLPHNYESDRISNKHSGFEAMTFDSVARVLALRQINDDSLRHDELPNCRDSGCEVDSLVEHGSPSGETLKLDLPPPPPKPMEEKIVRKIELLCQYIAKNGPRFEDMTRKKEFGNPEFEFLFGGEPGSEAAAAHEYFVWMKKKCSLTCKLHEGQHHSDSSLRPSGIDSSLQPESLMDASLSPLAADSDMDMEDDITQHDEEQQIYELLESLNHESVLISNELHSKEQLHALQSAAEHSAAKDAISGNLFCSGPSGLVEQGEGRSLPLEHEHSASGRSLTGVDSSFMKPVRAVECPSDGNIEKSSIRSHEDVSQSNASAAAAGISSEKVPSELTKGASPFRFLQDYASDDSSENDDEPRLENVSPATVSPSVEAGAISLDGGMGSDLQIDLGSKGLQEFEKGFGPFSESVVTCSVGMPSKSLEPSIESLRVVRKTDPTSITGKPEQFVDDSHGNQESVDSGTSRKAFEQKNAFGGGGVNAAPEGGKSQKEDAKCMSTQLKVDEFGRLVREGASDSDSDDSRYSRRHGKRGRSWSRSRSPHDKRRRSPQRRKDKRSRSRSWSPKKQRSRSKSPLFRRGGELGGDKTRRDKGQLPDCFDFRRGKCYRGALCRYLHHESDKSDGSRRYKSKLQYQEVPPSSKNFEISNYEHDEVKSQETCLYQDLPGISFAAPEDRKIYQKEVVSVRNAEHPLISDQHVELLVDSVAEAERARGVTEKVQEAQDIKEELVEPTIELPGNDNSLEAEMTLQLVDSFSARLVTDADAETLAGDTSHGIPSLIEKSGIQQSQDNISNPVLQNSAYQLQQMEDFSASYSSPVQTSTTIPDQLLISEPHPTLISSIQPSPDKGSMNKPYSSENISSQCLAGQEFSPPIPRHHSQLPPPPASVSHGTNFPFPPQVPKDYNMMPPTAKSHSQSASPHQAQLPYQHSNFSVPPNSSWNSLPPPPPPPPPPRLPYVNDLTVNVAATPHGVPSLQFQQNQPPPKNDFPSQMFVRPYPTELPTHSQVGEFQHRTYPPTQVPDGSLYHTEDLRPSMYHMSNPMAQQFGSPSIVGEDRFPPLSVQGSISSNSFVQKNMNPRPVRFSRESSFFGDNMPPGELLASSSQSHPYLPQPPYGLHRPAADSVFVHLGEPGKINATMSRYTSDILDRSRLTHSDFGVSRISNYYNPYASTFDQPLSSKFNSNLFNQEKGTPYGHKYGAPFSLSHVPLDGQGVGSLGSRNMTGSPNSARAVERIIPRSSGDQYDPLFDSIEPTSKSFRKSDHGQKHEMTDDSDIMLRISGSNKPLDVEETNKQKEAGAVAVTTSLDNDEYGEMADAEVGAVENGSPSDPIDLANTAAGDIEIDQVKTPGKSKKSKDSRSMKLFKVALADFVKEVLKPSWRQGNMSKEAFKTIVKKTVDKVSGAMKSHQIPKSQAKINQYIDSSQRKLTKLVMGYVDKYVKV